ncbi:MAG: hypothetical protein ACYS0D_14205 [Planctomycetota bacterium]|jgi:hypothetical protein
MTLILIVLTGFGCSATPAAPPATAPDVEIVAPVVADNPVLDLLTRLEGAQAGIRDFQARIDYRIRDEAFGRTEQRLGQLVYDAGGECRRLGVLLKHFIIRNRMQQQRKDFIFDCDWLIEVDHEAKLFQKRQIVPPGEEFDPLKLGEGPFPLPIGQRADEVLARFDVELLESPSDEWVAAQLLRRPATEGMLLVPKPGTELAKEFTRLEIFYDAATLIPIVIDAREPNGRRKIVILSNLELNKGIDPSLLMVEDPDPKEWETDIRPWQQ